MILVTVVANVDELANESCAIADIEVAADDGACVVCR